MAEARGQTLLQRHTLSACELAEVEQLASACNTHDNLLMRLDYNMLALKSLPTDDIFLYYAGSRLAGCLLLDRYHSDVKEVTGMVYPALRHRGLFTRLLLAARDECLNRGVLRLLFPCETTSASGRAFLHAIRAGREFAEHRMVLRDFRPRFQHDNRLLFREALHTDLEALAVILTSDFGNSAEQARQYVSRSFERPNQCIYLATYEETNAERADPVGTLRVEEMPSEQGIYGFFVRPKYRGRGYGRQILEETIIAVRQHSQKPIMLEVDINNFTALNLYRSLGFVIERTYEYYGLTL